VCIAGDVHWPHVNKDWKEGTPTDAYNGKVVPEAPLGFEPQRGQYRFLSNFATVARFDSEDKFVAVLTAFRDGVKYTPEVFKLAAMVVARIPGGLFRFSSMHVRRNELQVVRQYCSYCR
jgi:hypothetical protein